MYFAFWQGRLVRAALIIFSNESEEGPAHQKAALLAADLLVRKYGQPDEPPHRGRKHFLARWSGDGTRITIGLDRDESLGRGRRETVLDLYLRIPAEIEKANAWEGRPANPSQRTVPIVRVSCSTTGTDYSSTPPSLMIFTGRLPEQRARQIAASRARQMSQREYPCEGWPHKTLPFAETYKLKRRRPDTYLHYIDEIGLVNVVRFQPKYRKVKVQDQHCEEALNRLPPARRKHAECVTGTKLWIKP